MREIIYAGSFDPAHNGHLNTYLKAMRILKENIKVCICYNELKPSGLFRLEERMLIAKATFPTDNISSYRTSEEIQKMILNADLLVRGYRKSCEQEDKEYSMRLLAYYKSAELQERILFVEIDDEYEKVSSTIIKEVAKKDINAVSQYVAKDAFPIIEKRFRELQSGDE